MNCFIGIDIGTSVTKCILISQSGKILSHIKKSNIYTYGSSNRVEFSVDERYESICSLLRTLLLKKPERANVLAICISGASGNALLLDGSRKPIINAISWMDERAESSFDTLLAPFPSHYVHTITGWPRISSFPLAYFSWMKENEPEVYHSAPYRVTDFVYYNYRLTNNWFIDASTATNSYLQDQNKMQYHQPFLDYLDIKNENLPEIVKSGTPIGFITTQAADETHLPVGTPVIAGSFDHPSAARGTGMTQVGDLLLSCGTSWVGFCPVGNRDNALKDHLLVDPFLVPAGPWGAMFSFSSLGITINEYLDILSENSKCKLSKYDEEIKFWNLKVNKCNFNILQKDLSPKAYLEKLMNNFNTKEIYQSLIVSVCSNMYDKIDHFQKYNNSINQITMVGGYSKSKFWPQVLSNYLDMPISLNNCEFAGCIGAVMLAGMGVGLFENESDAYRKLHITSTQLTPNS